jgi:hypothetical protein
VRFKTFLEAKKPKKPEELGWSGELEDLRQLQSSLSWKPREHQRLQLFIPKKRDAQKALDRERSNRMWAAVKDLADVKEEAPPIGVHHYHPKAGNNKPDQGFWTSSAQQHKDGTWSSDWLTTYLHSNAREWIPANGFLFEIVGEPLLFSIDYADRFFDWAEKYNKGDTTKQAAKYNFNYETAMRVGFPWDELAKHFDGAHFDGWRGRDDFTYGWDVESTVWFDMGHLKYKGAVRLWNGDEDYK